MTETTTISTIASRYDGSKIFGTIVFIVGLEKNESGYSCVSVVLFWRKQWKCAFDTALFELLEEKKCQQLQGIDCVETCCVGLLVKDIAYKDSIKNIMMDFMLLWLMFSAKTKQRLSFLSIDIWFMITMGVLKYK